MTRLTGSIRILSGLAFVVTAAVVGWLRRSPWFVALLTLAFVAGYIAGKWRAWRPLLASGAWRSIARALALTAPIQALLVTVLYLAGLGASSLGGAGGHAGALTTGDYTVAAVLTTFGIFIGLLLARLEADNLERMRAAARAAAAATEDDDDTAVTAAADFTVLPEPVTPANFFHGIHYSHGEYRDGGFDGTPNDRSRGGDDRIAAAEQRLGVRLPEGLRALYRVQNGGSVGTLAIAKVDAPRPVHDDWLQPFGGYADLLPLELLRTLHDCVCEHADPDAADAAEQFPPGAKERIVLARWYGETLFLDYRHGGEPRVGFADFGTSHADTDTTWFADFDAFFARLRRTD
ncbi:MAG: SMI1/KNR4 family protein [Planctomycetes bacterium]|nr:SMI1/KNR4 family protein [Planctomycetota bacterium]